MLVYPQLKNRFGAVWVARWTSIANPIAFLALGVSNYAASQSRTLLWGVLLFGKFSDSAFLAILLINLPSGAC